MSRIPPRMGKDRHYHIGPENTSFGRSVVLVNTWDQSWTRHRYVLSFGAYGSTNLMVWANDLDSAIEESAEYLAKHAPGHVMREWSDEHKDLVKEVCEERGVQWPEGFEALEDEQKGEICEQAEADLTHTESGFLTSYEWGISLEDPSRAELDAFLYPPGIDWAADRA